MFEEPAEHPPKEEAAAALLPIQGLRLTNPAALKPAHIEEIGVYYRANPHLTWKQVAAWANIAPSVLGQRGLSRTYFLGADAPDVFSYRDKVLVPSPEQIEKMQAHGHAHPELSMDAIAAYGGTTAAKLYAMGYHRQDFMGGKAPAQKQQPALNALASPAAKAETSPQDAAKIARITARFKALKPGDSVGQIMADEDVTGTFLKQHNLNFLTIFGTEGPNRFPPAPDTATSPALEAQLAAKRAAGAARANAKQRITQAKPKMAKPNAVKPPKVAMPKPAKAPAPKAPKPPKPPKPVAPPAAFREAAPIVTARPIDPPFDTTGLLERLADAFEGLGQAFEAKGIHTPAGLLARLPESLRINPDDLFRQFDAMARARTAFDSKRGELSTPAKALQIATGHVFPVDQNARAARAHHKANLGFKELLHANAYSGTGANRCRITNTEALRVSLEGLNRGRKYGYSATVVSNGVRLYSGQEIPFAKGLFMPDAALLMDFYALSSADVMKVTPGLKAQFLFTDLVREHLPSLAQAMRRTGIFTRAAAAKKMGPAWDPKTGEAFLKALQSSVPVLFTNDDTMLKFAEDLFSQDRALLRQFATTAKRPVGLHVARAPARTSRHGGFQKN